MTDPATGVAGLRLAAPLQVWIPRISGDLGRAEVARDARRAFDAWEGDLCVWLSPKFQRLVRWSPDRLSEVAVPAELLEQVDVYHVGENGRVFGYSAHQNFPYGRIEGLLDAWLNVEQLGGSKSVPAPPSLGLGFPELSEHGVRITHVKVSVEGGATFPTRWTDDRVEVYWPPEDRTVAPTMFPDGESMTLNPPLSRSLDESGRPVTIYADGTKATQVMNLWPDPVGRIMPALSNFGDLAAQRHMARLARLSATAPDEALRLAREGADPFLGTGWAPWGFVHMYPVLLDSGPSAILGRAENLGASSAADLDEAFRALRAGTLTNAKLVEILARSPEFVRAFSRRVPVRRAWGALGLFWALLLEDLEGRRAFSECRRCQRLLRGKRGKQFCDAKDNLLCFRKRRAEDQRRSRGRSV